MIFSQNLNTLQKKSGMSDTQLESYTGVSRRTIGRILSHKSDRNNRSYSPSYKTVQRIAESLSVTPQQVFTERLSINSQ